ncbi:MAG: DNA primase [Candidatus Moranbacteria bacterium]|nr:DNA primase [Candidatus Moranbacteria bacterium]
MSDNLFFGIFLLFGGTSVVYLLFMVSIAAEVKSRLNIVDVVSDYVRLTKAGSNWKGLSPFQKEKTPSFMVSEGKQIWHCFSTNRGGDVFSFVMEMEGVDFRQALRILADRAGVSLIAQHDFAGGHDNSPDRVRSVLSLASRFWQKQLWSGSGSLSALKYLRDRGMADEVLRSFGIGFAPSGWRHLLDFLSSQGFSSQEVCRSGLAIEKDSGRAYDRFRERIVFPVCDAMGLVVGFSGRVLPASDDAGGAKYINTPETPYYHKGKVLYGLHLAKQSMREKNMAIVVEGNMDVLALHQAGFSHTVAVSGTALTPEHISLLRRYVEKVVLFFDMDRAGQEALRRSALSCFSAGLLIDVVVLSSGKDAADLVVSDVSSLSHAVDNSTDAMTHFFDQAFSLHDIKTASGRKHVVAELGELISAFSNPVEKMFWVERLCQELSLPVNVVLSSLPEQRTSSIKAVSSLRPSVSLDDFSVSRPSVLARSLVGLLLTNSHLWKKIVTRGVSDKIVSVDPLLSLVLRLGRQVSFQTEQLWEIVSSEDLDALQELFHRATMDTETLSFSERLLRVDELLSELARESLRERRVMLAKDLARAEKNGDLDRVSRLRKEFSILLQESQ